MNTTTMTAGAAPVSARAGRAAAPTAGESGPALARTQLLARLTGVLFLITFAASIPAVAWFYVPALSDPAYVLSAADDPGVPWGAFLELLVIIANIGTAVVLFPVVRRVNEALAPGFVAARLVESGFIAVGILSLLTLATLRLEAAGADPATLDLIGRTLVALHDWTFLLGPGFCGVGNGLMLGYLMYKSRLVPRALTMLGLVGGPLLVAAGVAVLFGVIEAGSTWQAVATIPEFFWELLLGLWLLVKAFNPAAVAALNIGTPASAA